MGMLQRRTTSQGLVFYVSPLLESIGVKHAFSTAHRWSEPVAV